MSAVGVLDKVVAILDSFGEDTDEQDPATIAARLGLSPATVYRLLGAMAEHRLVEAHGRSYSLGTKLIELAARARVSTGVVPAAARHLTALRDLTGETAEIHRLVGHSRVPVDMRISSRTVRATRQLGVPLPVHVGASGRVLLVDLDDAVALQLARDSAEEAGDRDWDQATFMEQLRLTRQRGWSYSAGERDPETAGVAAVVRDWTGAVEAALVASSTITRFSDAVHREAVTRAVRETALAISADLGHVATGDVASTTDTNTEEPTE